MVRKRETQNDRFTSVREVWESFVRTANSEHDLVHGDKAMFLSGAIGTLMLIADRMPNLVAPEITKILEETSDEIGTMTREVVASDPNEPISD